MKKNEQHKMYVSELREILICEKIMQLDFDHLQEWLGEIGDILDDVDRLQNEVELLKQDYINRISGMSKAIAVAERRCDSLKDVVNFVEQLPDLTARELIEQYKRTQAKFHDAFPTSFGTLFNRTGQNKKQDFSLYK